MKRLINSFRFALTGCFELIKSERNFQIHFVVFLLVVVFGFITGLNSMEWLLILMISALVMGLEAINTSIEKLSDFVHPDYNDGIRRIKDISAAAVLIAALFAIAIAVIIFLPYYL